MAEHMSHQQPIPEEQSALRSRQRDRLVAVPASIPALLAALGETAEESGREYERLRSKLILFFSRRLIEFPEDLADESLDRLARRIAEGKEIDSVAAFALGIARHVALEQMGRKNRAQTMEDDFWNNIPAPVATLSEDVEVARMERCLKRLHPEESGLLRSYYLAKEEKPIAARGKLAEGLGISANTLRQRVFLARQRLRDCMTATEGKKR